MDGQTKSPTKQTNVMDGLHCTPSQEIPFVTHEQTQQTLQGVGSLFSYYSLFKKKKNNSPMDL